MNTYTGRNVGRGNLISKQTASLKAATVQQIVNELPKSILVFFFLNAQPKLKL